MASPGQESESLNSQFLVDSMPAMITPPGLTATSITSTNVGSNTWASLCTTRPSGSVGLSFIARLKGLWPSGEPASRPEKNSDTTLASAGGWGISLEASLQGVTSRPARQQLPRQRFSRVRRNSSKRGESFLQGLKPVESTQFTSALKHRPPEEKDFFRSLLEDRFRANDRTQLLIAIWREPLNLTRFGAIGRNAQCAYRPSNKWPRQEEKNFLRG
jgi:hypothetical protein